MLRSIALLLAAAPYARACSACFSEMEGGQPAAIRWAVVVLLTPTVGVLTAIGLFGIGLWRRSVAIKLGDGDHHDA